MTGQEGICGLRDVGEETALTLEEGALCQGGVVSI